MRTLYKLLALLLPAILIPQFAFAQTASVGVSDGLRNQSNGGGSGCSTGSSHAMQKGNGSGGCSDAVSGTDFAPATSGTSLLKGSGSGTFANAVSGTDYAPATSGLSLLKGNNAGGFAAAAAGTDYLAPPSGTAIQKAGSGGALANAVAGTDYAPATVGTAILKGNGAGGFSNAAAGTNYAVPTTGGANTPLFADGMGGFISGTRSGNTTKVPTVSGTVTTSHYAGFDASGNLIDNGSGTSATPGGTGPGAIQYYGAAGGFAGSAPITGVIRGNGTSAPSAAVAGTDYAPPTSSNAIQKGNGSGGFASAVAGTDYAPATSGSAILKGNGSGGFSAAAAGTDYLAPPSGTAIQKAGSGGALANAVSGTDYAPATAGSAILKGDGSGGFSAAAAGTDYQAPINGATDLATHTETTGKVTNSATPDATTGLVNDINNNVSVAAADAANDGNDIQEIGTDAQNNVHIGGGGANAISLDNSSSVNQGQFASGAYLDAPANSSSYIGGTENCTQNVHNYVLGANSTITLSCSGTQNQTLTYYFIQPLTGSTFTYTFAAANGAQLLGDTPSACNVNGCIDWVTVTWIPSQNDYIVNLVKSNITGISTCPTGQTCYYVDSGSNGSDSNDGLGPDNTGSHHPWKTIGKANEILSSLQAGDEILFKGGATWTGTSGYATSSPFNNHTFFLGDTAAHSNSHATAAKPILISTYGNGARAIFDMQNLQPQCFAEINPNNGNPPPTANPVKYITISNFECERAYSNGVKLDPNGAVSPGMVVSNMNIHNDGYGYSKSTTSCDSFETVAGSQDSIPPGWQNGHAYGAEGPTTDAIIVPSGTSNTWYYAASACTSGGSQPSFPTNCTYGTTPVTGDGNCSWVCAGAKGTGYNNTLQYFDSTDGGNSVVFKNNIVKCSGGHNLLEVEGDVASPIVQGNTIGPGGIHGGIDLKISGNYSASPPTQAQILSNVVTCGAAAGHCGCQQTGGGPCNGNQTPSLFTESYQTSKHDNFLFALNTVYDSMIGFQDVVSANITGTGNCGDLSTNVCPSHYLAYNNTVYLPTVSGVTTYCGYGGGGNGNKGGSIFDFRNNICDGPTTLFSVPPGNSGSNWASTIESHNDLGGSQGYSNSYSFNGSGTHGSGDLVCASSCSGSSADPLYVNAGGSPPNFGLQSGSPVINKGQTGLTTGNNNIGAF